MKPTLTRFSASDAAPVPSRLEKAPAIQPPPDCADKWLSVNPEKPRVGWTVSPRRWAHACLRRGASIGCLLAVAGMLTAQPAEPVSRAKERDLNNPVRFVASEFTYPYSFRDTNGQLKGFAHDVANAVAQTMHLKLERVILPAVQFADALRGERIDVIEWWGETTERRTWAEFSTPIARFETVAVVRRGDTRIRKLADLAGKRVAVGQRGNVGWNYLVNEQPAAIPVFTDTTEQFLRQLAAGEVDAAVLSRLTAQSMIDRFGLKNLTVLDDRIPGDKYDVRYCFTVRRGDSLLLARLNEGLAILHRTGEFDRIYRQWFGRYERRTFTRAEVMTYAAVALAVGCIAALGGFLRQRVLSRRIARQAAELAQQRSQLAVLHDKHPLATVVLEISATGAMSLVSANDEARRLFELEPEATLPVALAEAPLPAPWRTYLEAAVTKWRDIGQYQGWETHHDATRQLLEVSALPLGADDAGTLRMCILTADVTKRRLIEQEVAHSRRQRALGELVGGIAHEFNNLLTPVLVTSSYSRTRSTTDPESREAFVVIEQAATRAAELTRRLLTFGRKVDERPQTVHLADAVDNCFALLRPTVDRRVQWTFTAGRALPALQFNPTDLNQIVFNLVINARDTLLDKLARPPSAAWKPQLRVIITELPAGEGPATPATAAKRPVAWQRLTVEDNGLGIEPGDVERIFEPFFTTKQVGKGTGLGLATVWHLANEAGGEVTVESTLGEGTRFHVLLPRWTGVEPRRTDAPPPPAAPTEAPRCRVLLVEDEMLVARTAMALLTRAGYTVTHQPDGAEAWAYLSYHADECDLLLADINMPHLNGVDLVRRVRDRGLRCAILMISGRVTPEEKRALEALRVDGILPKPFTAEELHAAIQKVVGPKPAQPARAG